MSTTLRGLVSKKANALRELRGRSSRSGQAMPEYLLATGILLSLVVIMAVFLFTFREYGDRVLELVSYDYP